MNSMMQKYGLIGRHLKHSFSPKYFSKKFEAEGIENASYATFELADISEFPILLKEEPNLLGLNVTIPYKEEIIPYLHELSPIAKQVGAVNTIQFKDGLLIGHNTDIIGFEQSLVQCFKNRATPKKALILGTGGAAKAVAYSLERLGILYQYVSRTKQDFCQCYDNLSDEMIKAHLLIINTTPLGMYPKLDQAPDLPYEAIGKEHLCYDLIYNPEQTRFLEYAAQQGAYISNGIAMLYAQAEAAWAIWQET